MAYNWRETLSQYASISGVLAGFSVTFIIFVLREGGPTSQPLAYDVSWGILSALLMGISAVLFIQASQYFLTAKDHDIYGIPEEKFEALSKEAKEDAEGKCLRYETRGRNLFNYGRYALFLGVTFAVWPFSPVVAAVVGTGGIGYELYQRVVYRREKIQGLSQPQTKAVNQEETVAKNQTGATIATNESHTTPEIEDEYERKLESEKARAIIWFAILAMIVAVRVGLKPGDFWNFPCDSPCLHVTTYLMPLFDNWIWLWLGYAVCMLVYFSEDLFHRFSWGRPVREIARRVGNRVFLILYPATVALFTAITYGSFQLPESIQTVYWFGAAGILGFLAIWSAESVPGEPIIGRRGVVNKFLELGREGAEAVGEFLVRVWNSRIKNRRTERVDPSSSRRAIGLLAFGVLTAVVGSAWLIGNLSRTDLWYVFVFSLYAVVFVLASIGALKRRVKRPNKLRPE